MKTSDANYGNKKTGESIPSFKRPMGPNVFNIEAEHFLH